MGDFIVQRKQYDVPTAGGTQSITAVSTLANAFELMNNNRKMSAGPSASAANQEIDDLCASVQLTDTSTLTYTREGSSSANSMRTDAEVVEYTGDAGGDNEFLVRGRYNSGSMNTGTASKTVVLSGLSDIDKCIPIITGIYCNETTDGGARGTAYVVIDSTTQATVHVGGNSGRVVVYFTVVEFTGANWSVGHGLASSSADTGSINLVTDADGTSGSTYSVSDWSEAAIFGQHKGDALSDTNEAISDNWPKLSPGATSSTVDWTYHSNHTTGTQEHMVHVLEHADMDVQRMTDTQNTAGVMNVAITSTLSDIAQAFVMVSRTSSGTGTAYGRGWVNARITSTSNVELWAHRSGNTISTEIQVVDLSGIETASALKRIFVT